MSTPFPLEQQAQEQNPATWDPWSGPMKPGFFAGIDDSDPNIPDSEFGLPGQRTLQAVSRRLAQGAIEGVSKIDVALAQADARMHQGAIESEKNPAQVLGGVPDQDYLKRQTQMLTDAQKAIEDDRARIKTNAPDPLTVGAAGQLIHGLGSMGTQATLGSLAGGPIVGATTLGGTEANYAYDESIEAGLDPSTAGKRAAVTGVLSSAGVLIPFGVGTSLLTKVGTGAITNTALGAAGRYADHKILEDGGYHEMADQVKVADSTQLLTDAIMGGFFGGQAYLHEHVSTLSKLRDAPGAEDAASVVNIANANRRSSPGVPTTPEAANIHQSALEKAISQVTNGERVDVSQEYAPVLYHGSPHDFDAFDMTKMGTGEGNQSYGHGLYFAEHPEVAEGYAESLGAKRSVFDMDPKSPTFGENKGVSGGTAYRVELPPGHMDRMLDWDRPISEQPHVMQALGVDPNKPSQLPNRLTPEMTGQEVYSALSKGKTNLGVNPTAADASRFLDEKGIPGIKYKDQGSRGLGSGTGTRNAVLFSDKDIKITHKNGAPVERPPEFLRRPEPETKAAAALLHEHLKQGNILDEESNLRDLEAMLAAKRTLPESPKKQVREQGPPQRSGTKVTPEEQQAYMDHADKGFEVKMNPASADEHGNLVSKDGETPVFEVTSKLLDDPIKQALAEKPDMTINGEGKAADMLKRADDEVAKAQKELPTAIKAATDCFARKGG